jgi:hypothetical protein
MHREFSKIMVIALAGWAALVLILSLYFRPGPGRGAERFEPALPVYEGASNLEERRAENLGWHNLRYQVSQEFPSLAVYRFYDQELRRRGWKREFPTEEAPEWRALRTRNERHLVARAQWRDEKGIYQIVVEIMATEKVREDASGEVIAEKREPGLTVSCTASRILLPVERD